MPSDSAGRAGEDHAIRRILEGTASSTGDSFFRELVRALADVLGVRHAWVTEFTPDNAGLRALAFWQAGRFRDGFAYALSGTPCERVVAGDFVHHPTGVQDLYPKDAVLRELEAESYMGVPLICSDRVLGHLAIIDVGSMDPHPNDLAIVQIFAARAAAELWRIGIEQQLRVMERHLTAVIESAMDAIVAFDDDRRIVVFNAEAERVFGQPANAAIGRPLDDLLTAPAQAALTAALRALGSDAAQPRHHRIEDSLLLRRSSGDTFPADCVVSVAPDEIEMLSTLFLRDISDRLAAEHEIERLKLTADHLQRELLGDDGASVIADSPAMSGVLASIARVAPTDASVLILGETGTGKDVLARSVHARSARSSGPFVKVNCGALPEGLVESELFGHRKGAFTGATSDRMGRFELADGGTLFLDEVGELPLDAQVKLLRVLQEGEFEPVGGSETLRVDVRIVAATNRELRDEVAADRFREDLYYRLSVFPVEVPPLRERREDIPRFVAHFVAKHGPRLGRPSMQVDSDTMDRLTGYSWPGNVRELENVIERALILCDGPVLTLAGDALREPPTASRRRQNQPLAEVERDHIEATLDRTGWVIDGPTGAARALGLHASTLRNRMRKLGVRRPG